MLQADAILHSREVDAGCCRWSVHRILFLPGRFFDTRTPKRHFLSLHGLHHLLFAGSTGMYIVPSSRLC
jgi:hypothetical protein